MINTMMQMQSTVLTVLQFEVYAQTLTLNCKTIFQEVWPGRVTQGKYLVKERWIWIRKWVWPRRQGRLQRNLGSFTSCLRWKSDSENSVSLLICVENIRFWRAFSYWKKQQACACVRPCIAATYWRIWHCGVKTWHVLCLQSALVLVREIGPMPLRLWESPEEKNSVML